MRVDVCVVGGGPAGLLAAIALRLTGRSVTVFDARVPPIDKACGEGLLPDTLAALRQLGVHVTTADGAPFRGVRFFRGDEYASAEFGDEPALGIRRTTLHRRLCERAASAGVDLRWGAGGVRMNRFGGVEVNGETWMTPLVVGADGTNSGMRQAAGLNKTSIERPRYGFRRHYALRLPSHHMELHWSRGCQLYLTPVSRDEAGVALLTHDPKQRLRDALPLFPAVAARLKDVMACSAEMGAAVVTRRLRRVCRPGVALIGDASGSVDAITGEGIGLAAKQALALAEAVHAGALEQYEAAHRRIRRRPAWMAQVMLLTGRSEELQRRAVRTLRRHPEMFTRLLALHVGDASLRQLCRGQSLQAGFSFLFGGS